MTELKVKEGDTAPALKLPNQDGKTIELKQFKGKKNVVLYFYPKDLTPGCTTEACDFSAAQGDFSNEDTVILGVSGDTPSTHQKFIAKHDLSFDLLSDEGFQVSDAYGVYQEKNFYGKKSIGIVRTTFIIDKKGKIQKIFPKVKVNGHSGAVLAALKEI